VIEPAVFPGALRTVRLVGRTKERAAIRSAIEAEGSLRVLHLIGEGGIGKTRLLEEIPNIIASSGKSDACLWGGIVDLYDTTTHSHIGIERAILGALDPAGEEFVNYRAAREEYSRLRRSGVDAERLNRLRIRSSALFVEEFNRLSSQRRVVLAFDTAESVQYESDLVQELCGLGFGDLEVRSWLLDQLPRLRNAVFVIASRPQPRLVRDVQERFGQEPYLLGPFSEQETVDYFDALAELTEVGSVDLETRRVIHRYSGGLPLLLSLIIEVMVSAAPWLEEFNVPLRELEAKGEEELALVRRTFEQRLVDNIQRLSSDVAIALPFLAWARRGMDAELLARLTAWPVEKCRQVLAELRRFSFVKTLQVQPGVERVFLHDAMYDLMDRYVLRYLISDREQICREIVCYYDELIGRIKEPGADAEVVALVAERLYYRLLADPRIGYAEYSRLADGAIFQNQIHLDMALRNEVLRFFSPERNPVFAIQTQRYYRQTQQRLDSDNAIRWVRRYVARGQYVRAVEVARRIRSSDYPSFRSAGPFFDTSLNIEEGTALVRLGQDISDAIGMLKDAVARLEAISPADEHEAWEQAQSLGNSCNTLGYAYMMQRKYNAAIRWYQRALPYLRQTGLEAHYADAEKNLSRVYALLGYFMEAVTLCEDSLRIFSETGNRYGEAYSLNVLGQIRTDMGHSYRAYLRSRALRLFRSLDDKRGIGLACTALGKATRKRAIFEYYSLEEAEQLFREAEKYLKEALTIFPEQVAEPLRAMEARNELGCVYRDWAMVYRRHGLDPISQEQQAKEQLEHCLAEASQEWRIELADNCEDLAQVEFARGPEGYDEALRWLDRAESYVEPEYYIREDSGLPQIEEPVQGYWLMLGKTSLLRGHISLARSEMQDAKGETDTSRYQEEAIHHYVLATCYFLAYSPRAPGLDTILYSIYGHLRRLSVSRLYILREHAVRIANIYSIDATRFLEMFDSTLGVLKLISE